MPRILPIKEADWTPSLKKAFEKHAEDHGGRVTNMKATLGHSLLAFDVYMQWYPLYEEVKKILGERLAYLFAYAVSTASNCPLCSAYFRKIMIDSGEKPEELNLTPHEKEVLDFGAAIATHQGNINSNTYNIVAGKYNTQQMVLLIAFAGQMIATNILNNVIETDIDEYLTEYLPPVSSTWKK
ncbi:MAG: hypothetical protein ABJA57_13280 [Ginsengibacter sp.]